MKRLVLVAVVAALVGSGVAFGRERSCALARDARACARACEESVCKKGADAEEPKISVFASFIRNIAKQRGISKTEAADLLYAMGVRGFDAGPSDSDLYELVGTCLKPINFYYFPDWFGCKSKNGAVVLSSEACLLRAVELGVPRIKLPVAFLSDVELRLLGGAVVRDDAEVLVVAGVGDGVVVAGLAERRDAQDRVSPEIRRRLVASHEKHLASL